MPQLFSIPLPNHPALMQVQNYMRRVLPEGTTFTDPATWHITLLLVEDAKGADLAAITVPDIPVFGVGGGVVERFPTGEDGDPIVLSIDGARSLYILQGALYYAITGAGAKVSAFSYPQAYRPHVTLAYAPPAKPSMDDDPPDAKRYWWDAAAYDIHLEVRNFTLWNEEGQVVKTWELRTEVPAQEQQEPEATTLITSEMTSPVQFQESMTLIGDRQRVHMTCVVEMRGNYPEIPLPPDIQREEDDVFITLPVGAFNAESLNGYKYGETSMRQMTDQINTRRPDANKGHIPDAEFSTFFEFAPVRWLAAVIRDGIVYAKGIALTEEAKRYYINAKRTGALVGTSLYAWAQVDESNIVIDLDLITLDLADPARVGVPMTAAVPALSSEMQKPSATANEADAEPEAPDAGAAGEPETAQEQYQDEETDMEPIKELQEKLDAAQKHQQALQEQIDAFKPVREERDALVALLGSPEKPVEALQALMTDHIKGAVETLAQECKVDSVRNRVVRVVMLQKPTTKEQAEKLVRDELDRDDVKADIEAALKLEMGPNQRRTGEQRAGGEDDGAKYHDMPEEDAKGT